MSNSMFTNYELTPDNYTANNMTVSSNVPVTTRYPLVAYDGNDQPIGYTWNYGDSVYLEFETTGYVTYDNSDVLPDGSSQEGFVEDAETYLAGKKFRVELYNFRYEVIAWCEGDAAPVVRVLSDSFYPQSLVKGTYQLKFTIFDEENNLYMTMISGDDCTIYIR